MTAGKQSTQRTQRKTNQTGLTGLEGFHRDEGIVSKICGGSSEVKTSKLDFIPDDSSAWARMRYHPAHHFVMSLKQHHKKLCDLSGL